MHEPGQPHYPPRRHEQLAPGRRRPAPRPGARPARRPAPDPRRACASQPCATSAPSALRAEPGPQTSTAHQRTSSSVTGPVWVTAMPGNGLCQRVEVRQRQVASDMPPRSAWLRVSTPCWAESTTCHGEAPAARSGARDMPARGWPYRDRPLECGTAVRRAGGRYRPRGRLRHRKIRVARATRIFRSSSGAVVRRPGPAAERGARGGCRGRRWVSPRRRRRAAGRTRSWARAGTG